MRLSEKDVENLGGISRDLTIETLEGPDALPGNGEQVPKILEEWKSLPFILQGDFEILKSTLVQVQIIVGKKELAKVKEELLDEDLDSLQEIISALQEGEWKEKPSD